MIRVNNVVKNFDNFCALNGLDLHVKKGSIYGLIGPNGAGKTTVINHITGAVKPDMGEVLIDGQNIFDNNTVRKKVLSIADDWYYFASFTIDDMARFYQSVYPTFNKNEYEKQIKLFELDKKRQIRRLSKGMKKQVAFILSLAATPDVLLLDEPLDGLDPVVRKQILGNVITDVSEREMTVLVSSHNLRELEDICDHVGIIHKGKMIIEKPLDDLKGSVHKFQVVFESGLPQGFADGLKILNTTQIGSVYNFIIKGDIDTITARAAEFSPLLCECINLTLEEVFIYELGGLGYDFNGIMVQ